MQLSGLTIILDSIFGLYRYFGGLRATKRVRGCRVASMRGNLNEQIHGEMLETVLRAKMIFYSRTRAGSIVQRFGKDLVRLMPNLCWTSVDPIRVRFWKLLN